MPVVEYANRLIPVTSVEMQTRDQEAPPIRQGPSGRGDRLGVRQYKIQSLHKGIGVQRGSETADSLRFRASEGLVSYLPFGLSLPYVTTTQATLTATNISGYRAANLRVHSVNSTLGQSKLRFYAGVGTKLYRNTSDANAALADSTLSLTDNITSMFEGVFNSTRYLALCTNGATNDISGTTDPTATPPALSTIVSLSAGDWVTGYYMPTLGPGFNLFYGEIAGVSGLWYLPTNQALGTAPSPAVLAATKNVTSTTNPTTSVTKNPTGAYVNRSVGTSGIDWLNPQDIISSNNSRATFAFTGVSQTSSYLISQGYEFELPTGALIVGMSVTVEWNQAGTGNNLFYYGDANGSGGLRLVQGGTVTAVEYTPAASGRDSVTDSLDTVGSTTRTLGPLSATDVNDVGFGWALRFGSAGINTAGVDHVPCTVTYRPPGVQANIPRGGFIVGADPTDPHTLYIVAPELQDEEATVNVPRILWKCAFTYDADGSRPVVTITKVNTGLAHIEAACFALAGIVVAGDTSSGLGKSIRLIRADGSTTDLGFNSAGSSYTESWGVVSLWGAGRLVIADVALEGATIAQTWVHFDGAWHPWGRRSTITALPLAWSNNPQICTELQTRYRFIPNGTNTDATRMFQPRSLFADPLYNSTTEVKEDGILTITLPDMDIFGPEESDKALLTAWCLTREVSATNTIRLRYSTDGGSTFTTWTTFTAYASKATLATPVSFRSLVLEVGLNHTAASAATPNGLPLLIEGIAVWPEQRSWVCEIDPKSDEFLAKFPGGVDDLWGVLQGLSLPVNTLKSGTVSAPCTWQLTEAHYVPNDQPQGVPEGSDKLVLKFEEVVS